MLTDKYTVVPEGLNLTIDIPEAVAGLQKALAEKGADHIEERCSYSHFEITASGDARPVAPGCIVGNFLHQHGITIGYDDDGGTVYSIAGRLRDHGVVFTDDALQVLREAQTLQDVRKTWGHAVAEALHIAEVKTDARAQQGVSA